MVMNIFGDKTKTPDFWNVINGYNYKKATPDEIVKEGFLGRACLFMCKFIGPCLRLDSY